MICSELVISLRELEEGLVPEEAWVRLLSTGPTCSDKRMDLSKAMERLLIADLRERLRTFLSKFRCVIPP
jgi:hypothetical protein